jgi:hypothetical protein
MSGRRASNQSPGEQAKQRIRQLGEAARIAAKKLAQSSPNTRDGDKAIREFQQQVTQITGRRRPPPLSSRPQRRASTEFFTFPFFLKFLVWVVALGLFAIVAVTFGIWGLFALTMCWNLMFLVLWPPPGYVALLFFVWMGLFTWRLIVFLY